MGELMEGLGSLKDKFIEAGLRDVYYEAQEEVLSEKESLITSLSKDIFSQKP
jgi:hypothetical protein